MTRCPHCGGARLAWSREDIIEALRTYAGRKGRPPTYTEWQHAKYWHPASSTVAARFGTWSKGIEAAGLVSNGRIQQPEWNRDTCIRAMRAWYLKYGVPPRAHEWNRQAPDRPTQTVVRKRFGRWNLALIAAGLEPCLRRR